MPETKPLRTWRRDGEVTLDQHSVRLDGTPWFPVMGEYHFSRDEPERWLHELRKMRAGGVDVVSSYLFWMHHEEIRNERSWAGHLDIRRFVEAADEADLAVMVRIGPWCHGESRNGGFPDWLQQLPVEHRTNDPDYLLLVSDWYADIARELHGLFRDGEHPNAPIIGIQVDNELYDQPDHLATLRDLAEAAGMTAPIWVATGWGGAQVPLDRLAPVYAGYPDAFWEASDIDWPEWGPLHFRFSDVRDDLSVGADVRGDDIEGVGEDDRRYPFLTCELGGGMSPAYHRRPRVDPEDVAALALTKIGSGSAWQGYYLYHGTVQVTGQLAGTQESHGSGYPNELPLKEYDYYSPLGPAGVPRRHHHLLRRQHLFLEQWGGELTQAPPTYRADDEIRWVTRAHQGRGWLFVNNEQPAVAALPERKGIRFDVDLDGELVTVPSAPVTVRSGAFFVWPLRQRFGDIASLSGTVQPITQVDTPDGLVVVVAATPGIPVELQIESVEAVAGADFVEAATGGYWTPSVAPGLECLVVVGSTRLLVLDDETADQIWRVDVGGGPVVVVWDGALTVHGDLIALERWGTADRILSIPALEGAHGTTGLFSRRELEPAAEPTRLGVSRTRAAGQPTPTRRGGSMDRLSAPIDEDFVQAAQFDIAVDARELDGTAVLSIDWHGDVARAFIGDTLVSDQFWFGRSWQIDLHQWQSLLRDHPLRIEILAWNGDAMYFLDARVRGQRTVGRATVESAILLTPGRVEFAVESPTASVPQQ